jgi:hypothetical protein
MLYTDPGSGVLLWQILAAGVVGSMFYVRKFIALLRGKRTSSPEKKCEQKPTQ